MTTGTEQIGKTKAMANHDHDIVHELNKRLDSLWRYDQYIANAEGKEHLRSFWEDQKRKDQEVVNKLRDLIKKEIETNCF